MDNEYGPIPHYRNDPIINAATAPELKLYRPKINFFLAVVYVLAHFLLSIILGGVYFWIINKELPVNIHDYFPQIWYIIIILFMLSLRFSLIWFVRVYQHYAKSETRLRCLMVPSCSEYAIMALKKYGAIVGSYKSIKRLFRCRPPGGIDYP